MMAQEKGRGSDDPPAEAKQQHLHTDSSTSHRPTSIDPCSIGGLSALNTALELLRCGLWPLAIKPGGKAPIGESWGLPRPTEESIRETFKRFPGAGVGLLLGPKGGIIDIECDGPEGEESLVKLFGGSLVFTLDTLGCSSARGPHHFFQYDARLASYGRSVIKLHRVAWPGDSHRRRWEASAELLSADDRER